MGPHWLSILPPLLIFSVACITQQVIISFLIGIISAALIAHHGNFFYAFDAVQRKIFFYFSDLDTIFLHAFLLSVGILISFFSLTRARYQEKTKKISALTARAVEAFAFIIAPLFCIDDYLGLLTIGFIMKEMVRFVAISKERLAFFVQSLGAPLVILVPISSWAAAIISQLEQAGIKETVPNSIIAGQDPLFLYVQSIPYIFYSFFLLLSLFFLVFTQITLERPHNQHFFVNKENIHTAHLSTEQLRVIFFSVSFLITSVFLWLLLAGGFPHTGILDALRANTSSFRILFYCTSIVLLLNMIKEWAQYRFFWHEIPIVFQQGFLLMRQSMLIIFISAIFGQFTRYDLQTGAFLAPFIFNHASCSLLPLITFLSSFTVTLFIGNGWGTFALFIPLIVPLVQSQNPAVQLSLFPQLLGALFSGGVCGNQLSPFAETTNMTSFSMHISPFQHAKTQAIYVLPALTATIIAYFCLGWDIFVPYAFLKIISLGALTILLMIVGINYVLKK